MKKPTNIDLDCGFGRPLNVATDNSACFAPTAFLCAILSVDAEVGGDPDARGTGADGMPCREDRGAAE